MERYERYELRFRCEVIVNTCVTRADWPPTVVLDCVWESANFSWRIFVGSGLVEYGGWRRKVSWTVGTGRMTNIKRSQRNFSGSGPQEQWTSTRLRRRSSSTPSSPSSSQSSLPAVSSSSSTWSSSLPAQPLPPAPWWSRLSGGVLTTNRSHRENIYKVEKRYPSFQASELCRMQRIN